MFAHILIAHDLRDTADMALCRPTQSSQDHEEAHQSLDRSLTQYAPPGSELVLLAGKPSEVVLQQVQELGCDLLVLGAHHQRHDFFSGTSLDRIARNCRSQP